MRRLRTVAGGEHSGRVCFLPLADRDSAAFAQTDTRLPGQCRGRPHPDRQQNEIGRNPLPVGNYPIHPSLNPIHMLHLLTENQPQPAPLQFVDYRLREFPIKTRQQPLRATDHSHLHPPFEQGLGHLHPDEPRAHDRRRSRPLLLGEPPQRDPVAQTAQGEHVVQLHPVPVGHYRLGSGGQHQIVVPLAAPPANLIDELHTTCARLHLHHLAAQPYVDAPLLIFLRLQSQQIPGIGNLAGDVVRHTAGPIRRVLPFLENHHLQLRIDPPHLAGRAHPGGVTANYCDPFAHESPFPSIFSTICARPRFFSRFDPAKLCLMSFILLPS